MRVLCPVWLGLLLLGSTADAAEDEFLPGVDRVVFVGDSITYGGQYIEELEIYARRFFPERAIQFINAGLPSETVSGLSEPGHAGGAFPRPDLHERLARLLAQTKPQLLVACYGMNDGIYYPFAEERFEKFRQGMVRLRRQAEAAGAKVLHITPPVFDSGPLARPDSAGRARGSTASPTKVTMKSWTVTQPGFWSSAKKGGMSSMCMAR
jgi:lysophospholipase L1-like esterase